MITTGKVSRNAVLDAVLALGLDPNEVSSIHIEFGTVRVVGRPETPVQLLRVVD